MGKLREKQPNAGAVHQVIATCKTGHLTHVLKRTGLNMFPLLFASACSPPTVGRGLVQNLDVVQISHIGHEIETFWSSAGVPAKA